MTLIYRNIVLLVLLSMINATKSTTADQQYLIDHVKKSIDSAYQHQSKLTPDILTIDGLSSPKVRHFLNNLCSLHNASYLEIGSWKGSTLISALYGNTQTLSDVIAIDNWSQFGGPKNVFFKNVAMFLPKNSFRFYDQNCFALNKTEAFKRPIDIFFYDGDHTFESQRQAFVYFDSILSDTFIAVVDDWNWPNAKNGTLQAFKELEYIILFEQYLPARFNLDVDNWWHGLYVAVIQKKNISVTDNQILRSPLPVQSPFIYNATFRSIANFTLDQPLPSDTSFNVKPADIIFIKSELMQHFFLRVHPFLINPYILITHWTDISAPGEYHSILDDSKLIAWFAQNVTISHPKLIQLPLGIAHPSMLKPLQEVIAALPTIKKEHLLYLNINVLNNVAARGEVQAIFSKKSFCHQAQRKPYKEFLVDLAKSKFVLSPHGFGLDCHRTWEALYVGAIPIVKSSSLDPLYEGLPVLIINDWNEITEEFLHKKWQEMQSKSYAKEKLYSPYWYAVIKKTQNQHRDFNRQHQETSQLEAP